ncbi:MAG: transposase [Pseudomonadota bacterium]
MAYLARQDILYPGAIFHITWQCHNEEWLLKDNSLKQLYYDLLLKYKDRYGVEFYSYCLMHNHPHLTGKTFAADSISKLMQTVNSQLAKAINKRYERKGQAIMDRFKSPIIQTDNQLLKVMNYNDLNITRTKAKIHPKDYNWCSYRYYAYGEPDPLITISPSYLTLGDTDEQRQSEYRRMVEEVIKNEALKKRDYSKTLYIGDPGWVKARYEEINEIKQAKRLAYLARQRRMMYMRSPP